MFNKVIFPALFLFLTISGQSTAQDTFFGEEISSKNSLQTAGVGELFNTLKAEDTLHLKFATKVKSVCKMKGCWMVLDVPGEEVRVTFKDYGFFVPKDIEGREVVVSGKAFLSEVSVEDQHHFAEDEGKSAEEIEKITEPRLTRSFLAEGVILKE